MHAVMLPSLDRRSTTRRAVPAKAIPDAKPKRRSMFPGLPTASLTLTHLFSSPFHFSVPCYQRPYSWTTVEAGQLLDDVSAAAGLGGADAAEPDYFLGTILLLDGTGGDLPKAREREPRMFEIIDGQQRLVTLALLTAALRDVGTRVLLPAASWLGARLAARDGDVQYTK